MRVRYAVQALICAVALLVAAMPVYSQDRDGRLAELERQLQALKAGTSAGDAEAAKVKALESEIEALKSQAAPTQTPPALPAPGVQGAPNPLQDDKKYLTGQDLLDEAFPSSIPIPGSNVRLRIGGYAKVDLIGDLDYVGDPYEFELSTIPVDGAPAAAYGGRFSAQAKESRLNFDFRSKAKLGGTGREYPLQAFLEIDFFEDNPSLARQPRLRHAYGVVGRFLAGQTWTTSGDLEALAGTIDFSGGDALYGDRVAQIRWQDRASKHVTYAVAVEDPKADIGNPEQLAGLTRSRLPNFAGHVRWSSTAGSHVQVGGDLFRLDWQGGSEGPSATAMGFGLNMTGRLLLGRKGRDALVGGGTVGHGSAHRVVPLEGGGNDAVITEGGLEVMNHWQAYVGFSHYWSDSLNSTISTNWAELDNVDVQPGTAIHRVGSMHVNLIWFPYKLASTGFEVMWGERVNKDRASGHAWRLQYMAKFKFN